MISLKESLINRKKKIDVADIAKNDIKEFILANYNFLDAPMLHQKTSNDKSLIILEKDGKFSVSCRKGLELKKEAKSLTNDLFEWDTIDGHFLISSKSITSLKGCPKVINGQFSLFNTQSLKTLEYFPTSVKYDIRIIGCTNLTSLKGMPKSINGPLHVINCALKDLKGCPNKIKNGLFMTTCWDLKSMMGCPTWVGFAVEFEACGMEEFDDCITGIEGNLVIHKCVYLKDISGLKTSVQGTTRIEDCSELSKKDIKQHAKQYPGLHVRLV